MITLHKYNTDEPLELDKESSKTMLHLGEGHSFFQSNHLNKNLVGNKGGHAHNQNLPCVCS